MIFQVLYLFFLSNNLDTGLISVGNSRWVVSMDDETKGNGDSHLKQCLPQDQDPLFFKY